MTQHGKTEDDAVPVPVCGLLLAAGAGSRMGIPKALVRGDDGVAWITRALRLLQAAGCSPALAVIGARAVEVEALLDAELDDHDEVVIVRSEQWESGMAASLRRGLSAAEDTDDNVLDTSGLDAAGAIDAVGVLVTLVDLPDLTVEAAKRVLSAARDAERPESALVRATYDGVPGHPVFIGRQHWAAVSEDVAGDSGAGRYLRTHGAVSVDCSDLGGGEDRDNRGE